MWYNDVRFNPRLPGGRRLRQVIGFQVSESFNPRLPGGRRPPAAVNTFQTIFGFNPRLPGGRRRRRGLLTGKIYGFQSTPSGGKATLGRTRHRIRDLFQSTPSGGKATDARAQLQTRPAVSIHAFRGEGDSIDPVTVTRVSGFNPRLPGGRRPPDNAPSAPHLNVSIHAFRGEGDSVQPDMQCVSPVSIHAFRGEGDAAHTGRNRRGECFNPRLPGGRRHDHDAMTPVLLGVSIHAFRGEGDSRRQRSFYCWWCVSIHAFRGEGDPCKPPVRIQ